VLLPASALADPALADGLRRAGWEVEQVAAYTTVTADACNLPPDLDRAWAAGGVDAVVLTAPSTTRAVLELLGPPPQGTGLVAIGATTAAANGLNDIFGRVASIYEKYAQQSFPVIEIQPLRTGDILIQSGISLEYAKDKR